MKKIFDLIKRHKVKFGVAVAVVVVIIVVVLNRNGNGFEKVEVKKADFVKAVKISGKVVSSQNVDLAFETGGNIAGVYKKVGDRVFAGEAIASIDTGELRASRDRALAELASAQAELAKLQTGTSDSTLLVNKRQAVDSILSAYSYAEDTLHNKVDQYFENGATAPEIKYNFQDEFTLKRIINDARDEAETELDNWRKETVGLTTENFNKDLISKSRNHIDEIKIFLDILSPAVNSFEETNTLSQTTIDKYRGDLATAKANLNASLSSLSTAEEKLSGATSDIPVQEAKVKSAQADVDNYNVQIRKRTIVSPIVGIVSYQEAKVGETAVPNERVISVISDNLEIEVYVPEINIPGVLVANPAQIDLDAYPGVSFPAKVLTIDPAETLRDGVSSYKVRLAFDSADPRILSGMSANVSIETTRRADVFIIPERATVSENGKTYVSVLKNSKPEKTEIVIGERDSFGNVEVLSGLSQGEKIYLEFQK